MAKQSIIAREHKRDKLWKKKAETTAQLKEKLRAAYTTEDEQLLSEAEDAQLRLQKLKRNALKVRKQNRCRICGRPRAVYRYFGLCRIHLREALMRGDVTGAGKSSW